MLSLRTATGLDWKIGLATAGVERKNPCSLSLLDDEDSSSSYVRVRQGTSDANDEKVDVDEVDGRDKDSNGAGRL